MKIDDKIRINFFSKMDDKKSKAPKKDEDLYDLDIRIKETVSELPLMETTETGNCTGTGRCSRGCQTLRGYTCVRCGPTEYTTCGSCNCR